MYTTQAETTLISIENGPTCNGSDGTSGSSDCQELTTLWVARLDDGAELKVTDPEEQHGDVEEEETEGKERQDGIDCSG